MKNEKDNAILARRAAALAKSENQQNRDNQTPLLVFKLDAEKYAIKYQDVKRIIESQFVTAIPLSPPVLSGVYYYEGSVIPVMSAGALLFGKRNAAETNLIVVRKGEQLLGLLVGEIIGQTTYDESKGLIRFSTVQANKQKMVLGVANKELSVINVSALFDEVQHMDLKGQGVQHGPTI